MHACMYLSNLFPTSPSSLVLLPDNLLPTTSLSPHHLFHPALLCYFTHYTSHHPPTPPTHLLPHTPSFLPTSSRSMAARKVMSELCLRGNLGHNVCMASTTTILNSSEISDMKDDICFIRRSMLLSLPVYNNTKKQGTAQEMYVHYALPMHTTNERFCVRRHKLHRR